jgi:thioredoxin reductase (NADPH)
MEAGPAGQGVGGDRPGSASPSSTGGFSGFIEVAKPLTHADVEGDRDAKVFAEVRIEALESRACHRGRAFLTESSASGAVDGAIQADVVIVGAGPCGLFQIFELGLLGIHAHVIDSLKHPGGQCSELYPEKPIYDIPALPVCGAQELVDRLLQQAKPFNAQFHMGEEVTELQVLPDHTFLLVTSRDTRFHARTVIIAGGSGSFQPRRIGLEGSEAFEGRHIHYKVKSAGDFTGKHSVIFGGGDSALDWTLEFVGKARSVTLVHRRPEFRAQPASVSKMRDLVAHGSMRYVEGVAHSLLKEAEHSAACG